MAKEKQHDLKKDKVSNPDETPSLEDGRMAGGGAATCLVAG